MKYLREYNSYEDSIAEICKKYNIKNYTINSDGSIDVEGSVNLIGFHLDKLPLKFGKIDGSFSCSNNFITNFKNAPKRVSRYFFAHTNELRDLYNMPKAQNQIHIHDNPVYSIVQYFIPSTENSQRADKNEWIELFNELDIIQDDGYTVILDRLKYFYEGTKLNIDVTDKMLEEIKKQGYKII